LVIYKDYTEMHGKQNIKFAITFEDKYIRGNNSVQSGRNLLLVSTGQIHLLGFTSQKFCDRQHSEELKSRFSFYEFITMLLLCSCLRLMYICINTLQTGDADLRF